MLSILDKVIKYWALLKHRNKYWTDIEVNQKLYPTSPSNTTHNTTQHTTHTHTHKSKNDGFQTQNTTMRTNNNHTSLLLRDHVAFVSHWLLWMRHQGDSSKDERAVHHLIVASSSVDQALTWKSPWVESLQNMRTTKLKQRTWVLASHNFVLSRTIQRLKNAYVCENCPAFVL